MMMAFGLFVLNSGHCPISNCSCPVTGGTLKMIVWAGAQDGSTLAQVRTN